MADFFGDQSPIARPESTEAVERVLVKVCEEYSKLERPGAPLARDIEAKLRLAMPARKRLGPTAEQVATSLSDIGEPDAKGRSAAVAKLRVAAKESGITLSSDWDEYLLTFLRGRKYRLDEALVTLCNYERMNSLSNWRWLTVSIPAIQEEMRRGLVRLLPSRCARAGEAITIMDTGKLTPDLLARGLGPTLMCNHMFLESVLADPTSTTGLVNICDARGLGLTMLPSLSREELQLNSYLIEKMMPLRLRGVFVINAPFYFRMFWGLFSNFMSAKIRERMTIVSSNEELVSIFGAANLPPDYGGTLVQDVEDDIAQGLKAEKEVRARHGGSNNHSNNKSSNRRKTRPRKK
jgi:hypothetical protein